MQREEIILAGTSRIRMPLFLNVANFARRVSQNVLGVIRYTRSRLYRSKEIVKLKLSSRNQIEILEIKIQGFIRLRLTV